MYSWGQAAHLPFGIVIYVMDHWYPWAHGIWHLFVLAGSACHYVSILLYV